MDCLSDVAELVHCEPLDALGVREPGQHPAGCCPDYQEATTRIELV